MVLNLTVHKPSTCIKDAVCAIPCTVENTYGTTQSVKIALFEGSTMHDVEPDLHYQDIPTGEIYEFNGFWDTLKFTPTAVRKYNLKVKLTSVAGTGHIDYFTIPCEEKPNFFDSLLASIGVGNKEQITDPMEDLFAMGEIPGFTTPPFTCPHCGTVFATDEEYISHLVTVINGFTEGWFA